MQIQPIAEEAHNTAMLTLIAERQELLYYRAKAIDTDNQLVSLEKMIEACQKRNEELIARISELVKPESDE